MHQLYLIFSTAPLLFALTWAQLRPSGDCFTLHPYSSYGASYTKPAPRTIRVSAGIICPGPPESNSACTLESGGLLTVHRTLNITTSTPGAVFDVIHDALAGEAVGPFVESLVGRLANQTTTVGPGQAGFYGFTPTYRCYAGVLGACIEDVAPGTWVEACNGTTTLATLNDRVPELEGSGAFVQVSDVRDLNVSRPGYDPSGGGDKSAGGRGKDC